MLGTELLEAFEIATQNIEAVRLNLEGRRHARECLLLKEALFQIERIRNEIRMRG
jgi:hypothetical protein